MHLLTVFQPGKAPVKAELADGMYVIGAGERCRIRLPGPGISDRHAILTLSAAACARLATPLPRVLTPSESVRFQPLIATRLLFAAADALHTTADHTIVENPTAQPVTGSYGEDHGAAPGTIRVRVAPGTRQILTEGAAASRPLELADPDAPGETFLRLAPGECFVPCFPGHRRKALTFSYDDGAVDDARELGKFFEEFALAVALLHHTAQSYRTGRQTCSR